jgi:hypothetical protein
MGQTISEDLHDEQNMQAYLLNMIRHQFDQVKAAVITNTNLLNQFKRLTHDHWEDFFVSKYEAVGYLLEEVFHSEKRLSRVFQFVKEWQN